jgi:hypothetical protein
LLPFPLFRYTHTLNMSNLKLLKQLFPEITDRYVRAVQMNYQPTVLAKNELSVGQSYYVIDGNDEYVILVNQAHPFVAMVEGGPCHFRRHHDDVNMLDVHVHVHEECGDDVV